MESTVSEFDWLHALKPGDKVYMLYRDTCYVKTVAFILDGMLTTQDNKVFSLANGHSCSSSAIVVPEDEARSILERDAKRKIVAYLRGFNWNSLSLPTLRNVAELLPKQVPGCKKKS